VRERDAGWRSRRGADEGAARVEAAGRPSTGEGGGAGSPVPVLVGPEIMLTQDTATLVTLAEATVPLPLFTVQT